MQVKYEPAEYIPPQGVKILNRASKLVTDTAICSGTALFITIVVHLAVFVGCSLVHPFESSCYYQDPYNPTSPITCLPYNGFWANITSHGWLTLSLLAGLVILCAARRELMMCYRYANLTASEAHYRLAEVRRTIALENARTQPYRVTSLWDASELYQGREQRMIHIEFMALDGYVVGASPEHVALPATNVGWTRSRYNDGRKTVNFPLHSVEDYGPVAQIVASVRPLLLRDFISPQLV